MKLLLVLFIPIITVFAQEPSFDDQFVSSTEYTKIVTSLHDMNIRLENLENKPYLWEGLALAVSIGAIIVSSITWFKTRPVEQKQYDSASMLTCFKILSDPQIRKYKKIIADERRNLLAENKPLVYTRTPKIIEFADMIEEVCNEISTLYLLGLLNKKHFQEVYGGGLVVWWKILRDDVAKKQSPGNTICRHFKEVAEKFIESGIKDEPY